MRDFFYLSLEAISRRIDETISNTSIRRLVDYNYTPQAGKKLPYPRLVTSNILVINPLELLEVAKDVGKFDVDLLQPDDDTENWIRMKCGLPLKSKTPRVRFGPVQQREEMMSTGEVLEPGEKEQGTGSQSQPSGDRAIGRSGEQPKPSPQSAPSAQSPAAGNPKSQIPNPPPAQAHASDPGQEQRTTDHGPRTLTEGAVILSEAKNPALPAASAKRPRSTPSPYWDEPVHENEAHVDWRAHDREISRAQDSVARILRKQKKKTVRAMADQMANALKGGQKPSDVVFPHDAELQDRVHKETARVHQFGLDQVRAEHQRLMAKRPQIAPITQMAEDPASVVLASVQSAKSANTPPSLHAEITVQDYTNRLADATKNVANDLRRTQNLDEMDAGELADLIFGAVDDYSEGFIDRGAQESVRGAMADGRSEGFGESQDELEDNDGFYERSCLLDKNTCKPCEQHDGDVVQAADGPPADAADDGICEGGPECRCTWYEVIRQALARA
jgi:hypothetical protein